MDVLDKVREKVSTGKNRVLQLLTPLEYMEYVGKMLLVLEVQKVQLFISITLLMNLILLASSYIINFGISRGALVISMLLLVSSGFLFNQFRNRMNKDTKINVDTGKIKLESVTLPEAKLPEELEKYMYGPEKDIPKEVEVEDDTLTSLEDISTIDLGFNIEKDNDHKEYVMDHKDFDDIWEE